MGGRHPSATCMLSHQTRLYSKKEQPAVVTIASWHQPRPSTQRASTFIVMSACSAPALLAQAHDGQNKMSVGIILFLQRHSALHSCGRPTPWGGDGKGLARGDSRRGSDRFLSDVNSHHVTLVTHAEDQAPNAIRRPDSNKPTVLLNTNQCENALERS